VLEWKGAVHDLELLELDVLPDGRRGGRHGAIAIKLRTIGVQEPTN